MLNPVPRVLPATCLALALMLVGCGKGAEQPAAKAAGAQVLPGTISDAMINVDQSRSQPLLQPAPPPQGAPTAAPGSVEATDTANESVPATTATGQPPAD